MIIIFVLKHFTKERQNIKSILVRIQICLNISETCFEHFGHVPAYVNSCDATSIQTSLFESSFLIQAKVVIASVSLGLRVGKHFSFRDS